MTIRLTKRTTAAICLALVAGCGLSRTLNPPRDVDTTPPALPETLERPAVLVYTKTNGFRHKEAIPAGLAAFQKIAHQNGWTIFHTENGAVHNSEQLGRFDAVVWHNVSGPTLSDEQRAAFRSWIENGGGFVGIHGSGGDFSYDWEWYLNTLLGGAQFIGHPMGPQFQEATVRIEDREHPATSKLGETWVRTDEWYSFDESPRGEVTVLATLDESTYNPKMRMFAGLYRKDLEMGADHPIIWYRCVGEGRAFYSALGHQASAYEEPEYLDVLEGAIRWAAGLEGPACKD